MSHMTASRTGTLTWQYGIVATTVFSVAAMLLVGCASRG